MVSPRKRILQASTTTRPVTATGTLSTPPTTTTATNSRVKTRSKIPLAFEKYKFYLDIRGKAKASLVEDLKNLGGQIEECLSKEVTHVISDCPEWKFPTTTTPCPAGPPSPWTPTQTPSPATSTSVDSADRRRCVTGPNSRAEAILSKVKGTTSKVPSSSSVLDTARRLNIEIWSQNKTLVWLAKFKSKYGSTKPTTSNCNKDGRGDSKSQRVLTSPSIKLENEVKNTRPVYQELKQWPVLYFDGRPGSSPFSVPSCKQKTKKLAKRLDVQREPPVKKVVKKEDKQLCQVKKRNTGGFCEICNKNFSELERHLSTEQHLQFISDQENWAELDQCMRTSFNQSL